MYHTKIDQVLRKIYYECGLFPMLGNMRLSCKTGVLRMADLCVWLGSTIRAPVGIITRLQSDIEFKRTFSSVFEPSNEIEYRHVGDGVGQ